MTKENRIPSKDRVLRYLLSSVIRANDAAPEADRRDDRMDFPTARELIGAIASWAGKGKDEIVQVLCREIGQATAAVLREPLTQILENRKLQITLEFVPKNQSASHAVKSNRKKTPVATKKPPAAKKKKRS